MSQGESFRIKSGIIAPLIPVSGKSLIIHCLEKGEISKCNATKDFSDIYVNGSVIPNQVVLAVSFAQQ